MKSVYQAANITDAKLVQQLLEAEGIVAFVNGEYLQGALGELPLNNSLRVEVADAAAGQARDIVREWERTTPQYDADEDEVAPVEQPFAARSGLAIFGKAAWFFAGTVLATGVIWAYQHRATQGPDLDFDNDGVVDERLHFEGDWVVRIEVDRNKDHKFDQVIYNEHGGPLQRVESDNDFNGKMETEDLYEAGRVVKTREDRNHDGKPEYQAEYLSGVPFREEWFDSAGNCVKRVIYRNSQPIEGAFDSDGDGRLDTARQYNALGEIVSSDKMP